MSYCFNLPVVGARKNGPLPPLKLSIFSDTLTHSIIHLVLFVRACVETHRIRTLRVSDENGGSDDGNLPEVSAVQKHGNAPVVVPVSIAGQGGSAEVYMITGPDGRPQLLAPVGTRLVVVPSDGQHHHVAVAEAGSAQVYEMNVETRVNELEAGQQWDQARG